MAEAEPKMPGTTHTHDEQKPTLWQMRLESLLAQLMEWAKDFNWPVRKISKSMTDQNGHAYAAPALIIQCDTARVMIEPVTDSSPGTEGVVDLYVMPGYDDIATLYYYDQAWHLQRAGDFAEISARQGSSNTSSQLLTQVEFQSIIHELANHG